MSGRAKHEHAPVAAPCLRDSFHEEGFAQRLEGKPMIAPGMVVVGAGQAGGWAVRTLRDEGYQGPILLCGAELHAPYERPPLSKGLLRGHTPPADLELFSEQSLADLGVAFLPGARVRRLDPAARNLALADGREFAYEKLLLCTGGRALRPALPGAGLPGVRTLRTLDDAQGLGAALQGAGRRLAVIGGGWIGLEVAATARQMGCQVTVVEAAPSLCSRSLASEAAGLIAALHREQGVDILVGEAVAAVEQDSRGLRVLLNSGKALDADIVVLGTGMQPNDELAREAGLACDRGVVVDAHCRSSDPHIFAAGDVAVIEHARAGGRLRLESWQNAQDQGCAAARAMLGLPGEYQPVPLLWSEQYDAMIQICGFVGQAVRTVMRGTLQSGKLLAFGLDAESRVVMAVGLNAGRDFRDARRWVQEHRRLDPDSLRDPRAPLAGAAA
jgi:3-phenylpropionate/trans-cinnamate dioxygenase ferredoxin reductase subunit